MVGRRNTGNILFSLFFLAVIIVSCSSQKVVNYTITEKDIIPEGLAFDSITQTIYVSSTYKRKIVKIDNKGIVSDFINESQDDIKSVIGMEVDNKRNCLWAISSQANEVLPLEDPEGQQWRSTVYCFRLNDGQLIKKYLLNKDSVFLNDLTVASDGRVYVTESVQNGIYELHPDEDTLRPFLNPTGFNFLNGISLIDQAGWLFVCSSEGIIRINGQSKEYHMLPAAQGIATGGIDGLSYHDGYFIAHLDTGIALLHLSPGRDSITGMQIIDNGKDFDGSTTGEVAGNYYYYIVNSQIQSGIDFPNHKLKPLDSLENVIIRKTKLPAEYPK